jgi:hypothetical protein
MRLSGMSLLCPWAEPQPAPHGVALLLPRCCERLHSNWLRVFEGSEFGLSRLGRWIPEIGGKMRPEKLSDLRKPKLRRNRITSTDFWPFWAPGNRIAAKSGVPAETLGLERLAAKSACLQKPATSCIAAWGWGHLAFCQSSAKTPRWGKPLSAMHDGHFYRDAHHWKFHSTGRRPGATSLQHMKEHTTNVGSTSSRSPNGILGCLP